MLSQILKGDIGTVIELTIKDENAAVMDLSSATIKQMKFLKPTGVEVVKTAAFTTDGSDGKIRYTTIANDMSVVGDWWVQAYIEIGANPRFHTSRALFEVIEAGVV